MNEDKYVVIREIIPVEQRIARLEKYRAQFDSIDNDIYHECLKPEYEPIGKTTTGLMKYRRLERNDPDYELAEYITRHLYRVIEALDREIETLKYKSTKKEGKAHEVSY